ncbi:MAG: HAD family hydrolase [Verrucomicrobiales bacterium]
MHQLPTTASAAIFDLDGTLLDTLGDLADAVNVALAANGYPQHSEAEICSYIGDGAQMLIHRALPDGVGDQPGKLAECLASFESHYGEHYAQRTRPYLGIPELLSSLHERGIPLGILSNKPHVFTLQCAETYFGTAGVTFQVVLGQREGIPKKPDAAGALEAAAMLGVAPGECLYVGDSAVDMQTATAAGMFAIGVGWGFRPVEELYQAGALVVIESPADLLAAFGRDGVEKNQAKNA